MKMANMDDYFDVVIVGTGAAGLYCALNLPARYRILLLTKQKADESDSFLAQGGICMQHGEADYRPFFDDTMRAGHYENNPATVDLMIRSSNSIIRDLVRRGVRFARDDHGALRFTREGAHSRPRILFHEDITGHEITQTLLNEVLRCENIELREHTTLLDFFADASACGNETASDRPMMRKYIVESVLHWAREYHIDGFRFDLMGIHDIRTMNEVRAALTALDPSIIVYGEGWAAQAPQLPQDSLAMKANTYRMPGIAAFSDEMRDALRGPFNDNKQGAFLAGLPGGEESIKFGIVGAVQHPQVCNDSVNYSQAPWAGEPTQMISYVSCHDDMCLVDRLRASIPGIKDDELARLDKLAQTAVFTSQGIPFIYAGEEVMRDKKGVHNSYQSPDSINAIDWSRKALHADVFAYYKGLIQLRKNHPAFRLDSAELVRRHLEFLPVEGKNLVAWRLKEHAGGDRWEDIVVVLNSRREPARVAVPQGNYTIVCKDGAINEGGLAKVSGAELTVPAQSALIAWK